MKTATFALARASRAVVSCPAAERAKRQSQTDDPLPAVHGVIFADAQRGLAAARLHRSSALGAPSENFDAREIC